MKALLIVDVQNDFLPGGALAISQGDQIIDVINQIQPAFSLIVATKDWHPANHISFASVHGQKPGETIEIKGIRQELWADHCIQGSLGAEFSSQLSTKNVEKVFFKGVDPEIDSYSTFYDNAHLRSTGLGDYLRTLGVTDIYIVGLATDYCVKYSVFDALRLGFNVTVIVDGCRGIDLKPGDIDRALQEMKKAGATLITSAVFLAQLSQN